MSQIVRQIYIQMLSKKYVYYSETQQAKGLLARVSNAQEMIDEMEATKWIRPI